MHRVRKWLLAKDWKEWLRKVWTEIPPIERESWKNPHSHRTTTDQPEEDLVESLQSEGNTPHPTFPRETSESTVDPSLSANAAQHGQR